MEKSIFRRFLDFLTPRTCAVCGTRLSTTEEPLCPACLLGLPRTDFFASQARSAGGGQSSFYDNPMARLFYGIVPLERAAAFCYYEPGSDMAQLVYKMKYRDRPDIGEALGRLMGRELLPTGFFEGIDCVVPVPLAPKRQRQRGYNQSRCLALGISDATSLPVSEEVICRTVFVGSQTQLSRSDRQANVENVFRLRDSDSLRGRHVLLVDDIVTTGATVTACVRELLKVDGLRVSLLAFGFTKS